MINGETFLKLLVIAVGTLFGWLVPTSWRPSLVVVDIFSVVYGLYFREKSRINFENAGKDWSMWDIFSFLRNVYIIALARFCVVSAGVAFFEGKLESFDIVATVIASAGWLKQVSACLLVLFAFESILATRLSRYIVYIVATTRRTIVSMYIFETFADTAHTAEGFKNILLRNGTNGGNTIITLTLIDPIFRGDISVLYSWITNRAFFLMMPVLQYQTSILGLDTIFLTSVSPHLKTLSEALNLKDNHIKDTAYCLTQLALMIQFVFAPTWTYYLKQFLGFFALSAAEKVSEEVQSLKQKQVAK